MSDDERIGDSVQRASMGERRALLNLAFRMLGSSYDAEDVVQDTYARWYAMSEAEQQRIRSPLAWLVRVASRICLDQLASARRRRERYVGEWLPEPIPDGPKWNSTGLQGRAADPADHVTLDESVSMGMLVVLESLTPAERVSFVLHDVFGIPFDEIAETVGRSPAACRQLATSARRRIRASRPEPIEMTRHQRIVSAFKQACDTGDMATLVGLLDPNVVLHADGGGKVRTALRPVFGPEKVARLFLGYLRKEPGVDIIERNVNGRPGLVLLVGGSTVGVLATELAENALSNIWLLMNPEKLHAWSDPPGRFPMSENGDCRGYSDFGRAAP